MPTFYICQLGQLNYTTLKTLGYSNYFNMYLGKLKKYDSYSEYVPQWTGKFGNQSAEEILKSAFQYDYSDVKVENR